MWGSVGIAPQSLKFGTRWWTHSKPPMSLTLGKKTLTREQERLNGTLNRSESGGVKSLASVENRTTIHRSSSPWWTLHYTDCFVLLLLLHSLLLLGVEFQQQPFSILLPILGESFHLWQLSSSLPCQSFHIFFPFYSRSASSSSSFWSCLQYQFWSSFRLHPYCVSIPS
jgi:hypothetical protein